MKKKKPLYEYHPVPGVFSFQVNVPHKDYGHCDYFIPTVMRDWLHEHNLKNYLYGGQTLSGDGYTNGITNIESCYIVKDATEEDALAFGD